MADLATDIRTYLKTKTAVTDLVGSGTAARIYEDDAKQGLDPPYIVFVITPGESYEDISGPIGLCTSRVTFLCYGTNRATAYTLSEAVRLAPFQGYRGAMGTTTVKAITAAGSTVYGRDKPTSGGNQRRWFCGQSFIITYAEATS